MKDRQARKPPPDGAKFIDYVSRNYFSGGIENGKEFFYEE
jgi:hypothetical protein